MGNRMRELGRYISGFIRDWVALMSGVASIVLTFIGIHRGSPIPNSYVWEAAAICFFIASFRVWLAEHRRAEAAIKAGNELQNRPETKWASNDPLFDRKYGEVARIMATMSPKELVAMDDVSMGKEVRIISSDDRAQALMNGIRAKAHFVQVKQSRSHGAGVELYISNDYVESIAAYFKDHPITASNSSSSQT
jgi:hypothetical protein